MADLQDEIDDYYDKHDLNAIDKEYKRSLGPTMRMLQRYQRPGENRITDVMLHKALASEASGERTALESVSRENAAAFGSNPSALNASLSLQRNLASQRPAIEASVEAAKPAVTAGIGNAITNTMMARPAYMSGRLQPYFANESAIATQEQIDIAKAAATPGEGASGIEALLGSLLSSAVPAGLQSILAA